MDEINELASNGWRMVPCGVAGFNAGPCWVMMEREKDDSGFNKS